MGGALSEGHLVPVAVPAERVAGGGVVNLARGAVAHLDGGGGADPDADAVGIRGFRDRDHIRARRHKQKRMSHVIEFVRPRLRPEVLPAAAVETAHEGDSVLVAGWPVARQHPRGKSGTVFVTVEDETGDVQLILWPRVFARFRRELESRLIVAHGTVSRWDGTTNVIVSRLERLGTRAPLPSAHDWR